QRHARGHTHRRRRNRDTRSQQRLCPSRGNGSGVHDRSRLGERRERDDPSQRLLKTTHDIARPQIIAMRRYGDMKPCAFKWWISLAVMAFVVFTSGLAFAQLGNGLAAVGLVDPANGFPKWYIDHAGLQLGPCLVNDANDSCGLIAGGALPNPALPVSFPGNFP